jgi:hypothetical protein
METTSKSPAHEKKHDSSSEANPDGKLGRLIFFGPSESIRKMRLNPGESPLGKPVTRKEIKELTIEYVRRVTNAAAGLDTYKEPMTLLIEREDIEVLFSDPRCKSLVALLAVETKEDNNKPHQTFVLMPCDEYGRLVGSISADSTEGRERWPILRSVESIRKNGDIERDVETFLKDEFHI